MCETRTSSRTCNGTTPQQTVTVADGHKHHIKTKGTIKLSTNNNNSIDIKDTGVCDSFTGNILSVVQVVDQQVDVTFSSATVKIVEAGPCICKAVLSEGKRVGNKFYLPLTMDKTDHTDEVFGTDDDINVPVLLDESDSESFDFDSDSSDDEDDNYSIRTLHYSIRNDDAFGGDTGHGGGGGGGDGGGDGCHDQTLLRLHKEFGHTGMTRIRNMAALSTLTNSKTATCFSATPATLPKPSDSRTKLDRQRR